MTSLTFEDNVLGGDRVFDTIITAVDMDNSALLGLGLEQLEAPISDSKKIASIMKTIT
jgi:hypothetical protein